MTLQIVPFSEGAHPAIAGPFSILKFPHPDDEPPDTPAVYIETIVGQLFLEDVEQVKTYETAFQRLTATALPVADTIGMIAAAAADLAPS